MPTLRLTLLAALCALGVTAPAGAQSRAKQAEELVDRLARDKTMGPAKTYQTFSELVSLGQPGFAELGKRWPELDEERGGTALALLARVSPRTSVGPVLAATESDNVPIRRAASAAMLDLVKVAPDKVREAATRLLRDPDESIAISAVDCLTAIGDRSTWVPLLDFYVAELLNDPTTSLHPTRPRLLSATLAELAVVLERHADHTMIGELFERTAQLANESADGVAAGEPALPWPDLLAVLGRRPSKVALPYLRQILEECYREQIEAARAATRAQPAEEDDEVVSIELPDPNLSFGLQRVFGEDAEDGIAAPLRPWPPAIREQALGAVAQLKDPALLPYVLQALLDPSHLVRSRALGVLGWVLPKDDPAVRLGVYERVIPLLVDRYKDLRTQAHRWLQGYSGDKTVGMSYQAWSEWLVKAQRERKVEAYLLRTAREGGFPSVEAMLAAYGQTTIDEYIESLGYANQAELLEDIQAEGEVE